MRILHVFAAPLPSPRDTYAKHKIKNYTVYSQTHKQLFWAVVAEQIDTYTSFSCSF